MARDPERELATIDKEMGRLRSIVQTTKTNLQDQGFYERTVEWHRREIAAAQKRLEQLDAGLTGLLANHDDGPQIIADAQQRILALATQRASVERHVAQIVQLRKLQGAVQRLESQVRDDAKRTARRERKGGR